MIVIIFANLNDGCISFLLTLGWAGVDYTSVNVPQNVAHKYKQTL